MFEAKGSICFPRENVDYKYLISYLNCSVCQHFLGVISPTLDYHEGPLRKIPFKYVPEFVNEAVSSQNISISRADWDAHETSWDFKTNELISLRNQSIKEGESEKGLKLSSLVDEYKKRWEDNFMQLHANEEELNRQFIEIYGLQDELTPDVPLNEITILQQGEISIERVQTSSSLERMPSDERLGDSQISIEEEKIVWHDDVLIKQLISYAVGCMMGRYSIDKPGLILANQGDGLKEYEALVPNSRFKIDDDGIIPIMPANTEFTDNITLRFKTWLSITFGEDTLIENINFIEKSLGKRLDDYFVKDFWKYHKKMYQNRPIYWLFSSKKGAFQCIVYMHRMNAYTAEKVRTNYLLPHIEWLINKQSEMQTKAADLSTRERKEMDNIGKQIEECREYHDRLHAIADKQIAFDLDDGVVVNYAKFGDVLMKLK